MATDPRFVWTSKGELAHDERGRPLIRPVLPAYHPLNDPTRRRELLEMAKAKTQVPRAAIEATERTPGADQIDDRPLGTGPRDAMNAEQYDPAIDVVPDLEEKGFHAGLVRQPAAPIGGEGELRGFEATGIAGPSKFAYGSLAHLKAAHNANEPDDPRYRGTAPSNAAAFDPEKLQAAERRAARRGPTDGSPASSTDEQTSGDATPQPTRADLRARLGELGIAEADQPGTRATRDELAAAVTDAEAARRSPERQPESGNGENEGRTGADSFPSGSELDAKS